MLKLNSTGSRIKPKHSGDPYNYKVPRGETQLNLILFKYAKGKYYVNNEKPTWVLGLRVIWFLSLQLTSNPTKRVQFNGNKCELVYIK